MTPQVLVVAGLVALGIGAGILASFGARYRVGRLLSSAPQVSVAEAAALARSGERRFVRVEARVDSDEDFEDAQHRPLVFRRTRFEARSSSLSPWRQLDLQVEAVPFRLNEGLDSIDVDGAALGDGLVVVPRRSVGVVGDLGERVAIGSGGPPATAQARVTVEQVSNVEHAIAAGVPSLGESGGSILSAGGGRPLILTTLEIPEAMRVLTGGALWRSRAAAIALVLGALLLGVGVVWWVAASVINPGATDGASPIPSILPGSDTRSSGQGPGLVGDPGLAIFGVLGIAVIAVLATLAYVRLTRPNPPR